MHWEIKLRGEQIWVYCVYKVNTTSWFLLFGDERVLKHPQIHSGTWCYAYNKRRKN